MRLSSLNTWLTCFLIFSNDKEFMARAHIIKIGTRIFADFLFDFTILLLLEDASLI